jgi:uncharacterized membrane protein
VALSLLELMVTGLLGNTLLPLIGITRPLDKTYLLSEVSILVFILAIIVWLRNKKITIKIYRYSFFSALRNLCFAFFPLVFVVLSIMGATSLNNGGSNIFTIIMLVALGIYCIAIFWKSDSLNENVIPTSFFFMALALLLMTSLRGWYVTGHDIQAEYKVFQLAKNAGRWSMASYQDAYNACLSITILPTIFSRFLIVADQYIYKFFFQIIFAFCGSIMYLISRNWLNRKMSFLAGLYFIAFPTFFEDMPFLIRQEMAFLFFGLMIYIIFKERVRLSTRRILFVLLGIGVILSHYSTTYTVLAILGLSVIVVPIFSKLFKRYHNRHLFKNTALNLATLNPVKINLRIVVVLVILSILWTGLITNTGGSVTKVIASTLKAIQNGFTANTRSIDAISLITLTKPNQEQEMEDYLKNVVNPERASAKPGTYFDEKKYSGYNLSPLDDKKLPGTFLSEKLQHLGINIPWLVIFLGQIIARLIEIIAPLGIIYLIFRKSIIRYMDTEYYLLAWYCLFFIALNIFLPILSTEYGVFRALQQSMFIVGPFVVIGSAVIGISVAKFIRVSMLKTNMPLILAIMFLLYSTALMPQLFGGNISQLHLNNSGRYYDDFLTLKSELYGGNWITSTIRNLHVKFQPDVQADKFSQNKIMSVSNLGFYGTIFPALVRKDSYIFLGSSNVTKKESDVVYNSDAIMYRYPIDFLNNNKNLIYNNGGSKIYK